ncbi:MAG: RraA family protein [Undibacterium sp.]|nr:RraA family protein [Opitutaceae bacterium]
MPLTPAALHKLKRWNTPTIANALEQISAANPLGLTNRDETRDFMPEMGPMIGYAMTVVISGGDPSAKREHPDNFRLYREYLASVPGPKIVVLQDLDRPLCHGSMWGEVGANHARALGCVGTITDGAVRDLDEMKDAGFKAIARRLAVSHAHCWPLRWGCEVEVFGTTIKPGQLIHADKHGFILIPDDAHDRLLEAARFMDDNECDTVIPAARQSPGQTLPEILAALDRAGAEFAANAKKKFHRAGGEWGA